MTLADEVDPALLFLLASVAAATPDATWLPADTLYYIDASAFAGSTDEHGLRIVCSWGMTVPGK